MKLFSVWLVSEIGEASGSSVLLKTQVFAISSEGPESQLSCVHGAHFIKGTRIFDGLLYLLCRCFEKTL